MSTSYALIANLVWSKDDHLTAAAARVTVGMITGQRAPVWNITTMATSPSIRISLVMATM